MPGEHNRVVFEQPFGALNGSYECDLLCDRVHLEGAQALAVYGDDFYAGEPALTRHNFGQGQAFYAATSLDNAALGALLAEICAQNGIAAPLPALPAGLEVMPRTSPAGQTLLYLLNHTSEPVQVALPDGQFFDLLSERAARGTLELPRFGVAILRPA